jgi:hypothetical protein
VAIRAATSKLDPTPQHAIYVSTPTVGADQLRTHTSERRDVYVCAGRALTDGEYLVTSRQIPGPLARVTLAALAVGHVRRGRHRRTV